MRKFYKVGYSIGEDEFIEYMAEGKLRNFEARLESGDADESCVDIAEVDEIEYEQNKDKVKWLSK